MKIQTRTLCLIEKNNIECEKCGISLNKRLFKNTKIAFSINSKTNSGFICTHCIQLCKNNTSIYQTLEQINRFLRENIKEINLKLNKKIIYQKKYREENKEKIKKYKKLVSFPYSIG